MTFFVVNFIAQTIHIRKEVRVPPSRFKELRRIKREEPAWKKGPRIWVVQKFVSCWLDGFWKVLGGLFRWKDHFHIEKHAFKHSGCHAHTPDCERTVQKVWFSVEQQRGNHSKGRKWNFVNVSWGSGETIIHAEVESAPCVVKWFNIY
jgi:hypothetical protein